MINKIRIIKVPKFKGMELLSPIHPYNDLRIIENFNNIEFIDNITLYEKQKIICDNLENKLKKRKTNSVVFESPAGSGKTIVALELISRLKCKTIIVLPNTYLINQWLDVIKDNFNISDDEILIWTGDSKKKNLTFYNENFKIILTTIHSSVKIKNKNLIDNNVRFTIYDEIHMYCSKSFKHTFYKTQTYYNLGITANQSNINGSEIIFMKHLNNLTLSSSIVENNAIKFNCNVKIIKNKTKYENILNDNGQLIYSHVISNIIKDNNRNNIIINEIVKIYDEDSNNYIFIFSDRLEHLDILNNLLKELRNDIIVLTGGSENELINIAKTQSRVIFTTYQYSATGTNIPHFCNLILTTPRKNNMHQSLGRILRTSTDENNKKIRQIIDIADINSICYGSFLARRKYYIENNYKINVINLDK
jgi:superfamily II DNA or RNA helicase